MSEFILIWLLVCPVCGHTEEVTVTTNAYYNTITSKQGFDGMRNLVECPKCGVAIFAKLKKFTEIEEVNSPIKNSIQVNVEKREIVRYERNLCQN